MNPKIQNLTVGCWKINFSISELVCFRLGLVLYDQYLISVTNQILSILWSVIRCQFRREKFGYGIYTNIYKLVQYRRRYVLILISLVYMQVIFVFC